MRIHVKCPNPKCDWRFWTAKKLEFQCGKCGKSYSVNENKD